MAGDWLSIAVSPVGPNHRVGSKGRKASTPNQTESHVEQVATLYLCTAQVHCTCVQHKCTVLAYSASVDNESEGVYVRVVMRKVPRLAGENLP